MSFFTKLKEKLTKKDQNAYFEGFRETDKRFGFGLKKLLGGSSELDDAFYQNLMQVMLESDVGSKTSTELLNSLKKIIRTEGLKTPEQAIEALGEMILESFKPYQDELTDGLNVILMVGVNGSGKTTSTAKLAYAYKQAGKQVMLAAADTFRAAAVEQLRIWSERIGVPCVSGKPNADPASVVVDACRLAQETAADVLIIDTAGRLQNKVNLMAELEKINRVIEKTLGFKAQHTFLVLDASTGQNALSQAIAFKESVQVSAVICTKMDGTAKGGSLIALARELKLPVAYIGLGEHLEDLKTFDANAYLSSITRELDDA